MKPEGIKNVESSCLPQIHCYGDVTSTFDVAFKLAEEGRLAPWDSVLARSQSSGRGQMRRHWDSPPGNLYATLRLPPKKPFTSIAAAVAIGALCANALRAFGCPVRLKWPNDLIVEKDGCYAKLGGILLEEKNDCLLAGIGINIRHAPSRSQMRESSALPAADLACERSTGDLPTPSELWMKLIRHFYSVYKSGSFFPQIWKEVAEELLLWRDEKVVMDENAIEYTGILTGIGKNGGALLQVDDNVREVISGSMWLADRAQCTMRENEANGDRTPGKILPNR